MSRQPVHVDIAFDSTYSTAAVDRTWTDVTEYVLTSSGIGITHGRQDELSQPGPNTCSLTLNNSDGRFTPGLASSPYYPNVKIGRPIRVAVNLCSTGDNGTFEADATGWIGSNATVSRSTTQANSGAASLRVVADTAANMAAVSAVAGTSAHPVAPSTRYRASAWVRANLTSRTVDMRIDWYDSGGSLISTDNGPDVADSTTWQQISLTATSPSTAAYARLRPFWISPNLGEIHYLDDARLDVDLFAGYVDEWPLEWPGVVSAFATSTVTASSRMARLGLSNKCRSVVEQEILADGPLRLYTCGEAEGATRVSDSSGNSADPLRPVTEAVPTFGSATGPGTDGLTAVLFPSGSTAQIQAGGASASLNGFGFFLSASGTLPATGAQIAKVSNPATSDGLRVNLFSGTDAVVLNFESGADIEAPFAPDGDVRHVFILQSGANVELYIDGSLEASGAATLGSFTDVRIGPLDAISADIGFAHCALFDAVLSADRIAAHAEAGLTGFAGETAADRLERYAGYAGIPSPEYAFDAAATPIAHIETTGQSPIELMQTVASTDGGVLYDGPDGTLTYEARTVRYNADAAVTLDVDAGDVQVGYSPKLDRSALINKVTATLSDGTYSVTVENFASVDEYGTHGPGDLELATTDADEAHAAAWWRVNTYGEPAARAPVLGVELAKMTAARQVEVLAVAVGDKITVDNLPAQSDATSKDFFVEGWNVTVTDSLHRIDFNLSPADGFNVWTVEDATFGQYDAYPIAY